MHPKKITLQALQRRRIWALVSVYDALTADLCHRSGVDALLVGDSVGMVLLGYPDTSGVTMDQMIHHAKAVRRGAPEAFVIGDMPLLGRRHGPRHALRSALRFRREAGCDAVKLEWFAGADEATRLIRQSGIPVMGHVGLTPQSVSGGKGFRARGRDAADALAVLERAKAFERAGAFSVLLECVPPPVASLIRRSIGVRTIGIGAGKDCGGQVLVFHDLTGFFVKYRPRFVRHFAKLAASSRRALVRYAEEVRLGRFPGRAGQFKMEPGEVRRLQAAARELVPRNPQGGGKRG